MTDKREVDVLIVEKSIESDKEGVKVVTDVRILSVMEVRLSS